MLVELSLGWGEDWTVVGISPEMVGDDEER